MRYIYIYVESSCNEDIYDQLSSKYQLSFLNSYSNVLVYIFFHFILEVGIVENNMRMQIDACLDFERNKFYCAVKSYLKIVIKMYFEKRN